MPPVSAFRAFGLAAVAVAVIAAPAVGKPTNPRITLGKSIGDVKVGMTRAKVERILGHGVVISNKAVEDWRSLGLAVFFKGAKPSAKAFGVITTNPGYYTPQHIRVGSDAAEFTSAYGTANCVAADSPTEEDPYKYCTRHGPPGRVTIFYFGHKGIERIALGADSVASVP